MAFNKKDTLLRRSSEDRTFSFPNAKEHTKQLGARNESHAWLVHVGTHFSAKRRIDKFSIIDAIIFFLTIAE